MKKRFTFLIAALMLLTMMVLPWKAVGQTKAAGDEITAIANIVSGKTYYIKGVRSSNTYYLKFTDATGSQSGTESSTTADAVPITFTKIGNTNTYNLTTPNGYYIAPGTSNGKITVSDDAITVTASNQSGSKIRLSITSGNNTWSIQKNTSGANFGGYKNTQTDITLIEAASGYTVTYDANGGTGTMTDTNSPYDEDDVVTLLTNTFTAPEGKMFGSWLVKDALDNTITVTNNQFTMPASNVTVFAQWVNDPSAPQYEWVQTEITSLTASDIFVIVGTKSGTSYSMSNNNGTSTAPTASAVTITSNKITSTVNNNMKWNISGNAQNGYTFYPNGSTTTWLYCNTTSGSGNNENMRVGTGARKVFELSSNYLVTNDSYTDRYVSVYPTNNDWRGYTSSSTSTTTISFYKRQVLHKITYSAENGSITGKYHETEIDVANNSYIAEGSQVDLTAHPASGYAFSVWSDGGTNTTLSSATNNPTVFTMGTSDVTIIATFIEQSTVATPTFSVPAGTYNIAQSVGLSCATSDATIRYTTDGTDPTESSTVYNSAISVTTTTTIKAKAFKDGLTASEIASATYTLKCVAPTFSVAAGTYLDPQTVALSCATDDASIKYSTNSGSTWLDYSDPIVVNATTTIQAKAVKTNWSDSDVASAEYVIQVQTPTFLPGTSVYVSAQNVEISCDTDGATIHYTTDGSTPTTSSTEYSSAIPVSTTTTIKAIAVKSGLANSEVGEATITIANIYTVAQARAAIDAGTGVTGVYATGIVSEIVTPYSSTYHNISYNISSDGLTTSDQLQAFRGKSYNGANFISEDDIQVGDIVIVYGDLTKYKETYEFEADNQLVSLVRKYSVTYNDNGSTGGSVPVDTYSPYVDGSTVTVLGNTGSLTKTGYTFNGWNTKADGSGNTYVANNTFTINENTTLYAQWEANTYSYTINITDYDDENDHDNATAKLQVWNGSSYDDAGAKIAYGAQVQVVVTSNSGYSYTLSSSDVTFDGNVFTMPAKVIAITVTTRRLYNITYSGSYEHGSVTTAPASAYAGAPVTIETAPATNYELTGITCSDITPTITGNNITFEMPAKDITITAITFSRIVYTVTYSVNDNVISSVNVNAGENIKTLPTLVDFELTPPSGFTFAGWTENDGVEILTSPYEPTATCTLYAVYARTESEQIPVYTLVESTPSNWEGEYLIVYNNNYALDGPYGNTNTNTYATYADISDYYTSSTKSIDHNNTTSQYRITVAKTSNGYSLYDEGSSAYLGNSSTSTGSKLRWDTSFEDSRDEWTLGVGSIVSKYSNSYAIRWNNNANQYRFAIYGTSGQEAIQLFKKQIVSNDVTKYYTFVLESNYVAPGDVELTTPVLIQKDMVYNMNGHTLINTDPANLIIEDGGQLITSSANVKATVKKEIHEATAKAATYWYAISSAVDNPSIASETNIASGTYDLYRYNETKNAGLPWENYKNTAYSSAFTTLEKGRGYLYRNDSDLSIAMTGEINVADFNYAVTKTGSGVLAGFNLIGNPYSHNIYKGDGTAIPNDDDFLRIGFYYMDPETGKWTLGKDGITAIKPNQGILVQTDKSDNIEMTNTNSNGAKYNNDNIMFKVANSQYSDETYAWFDKGRGLNKISHRNAEVPMIYINQDGEDYAIATMSDDTKMFSLNFKAMTMGKYTLSYKTKGEFNYLHVIDRLTGEDVDMLLEGEYSFVASPSDSDARFIVKLAYLPDYSDGEGDIFAYQNGSDIFVSGEGELQIFDVMGRFVMSERINGVKTISADELSKGVYVLRLVGNGMKTQKIVVK